jgi:hypothetical protein
MILVSYPDDTRAGILRSGHDCYVVNLFRFLAAKRAHSNPTQPQFAPRQWRSAPHDADRPAC